ncbi:MAG: hypothetical protein EOP84_32030, partial [Verrucomicrobiaceae bacterium]
MSAEQRVRGSFRDPSGYVFFRDGRVFRAVDAACHQALSELSTDGTLRSVASKRWIVETRFVEDAQLTSELASEHPGFDHFLEHERL